MAPVSLAIRKIKTRCGCIGFDLDEETLLLATEVAVAEAEAIDATQRLKRAEADVEALRVRCDDLDYLVARAVVAKSRGESVSPFPGGAEDSLLARFRALEEE